MAWKSFSVTSLAKAAWFTGVVRNTKGGLPVMKSNNQRVSRFTGTFLFSRHRSARCVEHGGVSHGP